MTDSTTPPAEEAVAVDDGLAPAADVDAGETTSTAEAVESAVDEIVESPEVVEAPRERIGRGALFALGAIPLGVLAWVLIWQLGFISAIVAFGVVIAATFLYRLGSGGRVGKGGLAVILGVTLVTLVISFLAGIAVEMADVLGYVLPASLSDPLFWDDYAYNLFDNPDMWSELSFSIFMTVVFTVLGTFGVIRQLSKEARAAA